MTGRCRSGLMAAAFVLSASAANAQQHALDRGSIQIGGTASLTSRGDDDNDDRITTLSLNPHLHYFVVERFAIGADFIFGYSEFRTDISQWSLGIGPSVTYYFGAPASRVHPYLSARAAYAVVNIETPLTDTDGNQRSASAAAGLLTMLSNSVGVTTELFYQLVRTDIGTVDSDGNTFGLAVGIAAFVF